MIKRIRLRRFKAFEDFRIDFGAKSILVGPNSAGKSTIVAALRASAAMLRHARARKPKSYRSDRKGWYMSYDFDPAQLELEAENLRHEFHRERETRVEVSFREKGQLNVVWPPQELQVKDLSEEEEPIPFYYLCFRARAGITQPKGPAEVRSQFPVVGSCLRSLLLSCMNACWILIT